MGKAKRRFALFSETEQLKALRYMGALTARIDMPMLHPDHIRKAGNLLQVLAREFEEIATARNTNVAKILSARVACYMVNRQLADFAKGDIEYIRNVKIWE